MTKISRSGCPPAPTRRKLAWFAVALAALLLAAHAWAGSLPRQVLAFYYGWYGNPATSGRWVHWQNVNAANLAINNAAHFPALGAYDSHDPAVIAQQAEWARAAGITGFIASWWGPGSFEDQTMPLLLQAAARQQLAVSAYYEKISGKGVVADLDYLLAHYGSDPAWLKADGQPVLFVYGRALHQIPPAQWAAALAQLRRDHPRGVRLIADSLDPRLVALFDGASSYNITGQIHHKTPAAISAWAQTALPRMAAAAGAGKIATVTIIPGYDDRATTRTPPRPVTARWGDETYRALWRAALAARPDYVLITSWNEWHEGSEIEPSAEYGKIFLADTASFAKQFLAR